MVIAITRSGYIKRLPVTDVPRAAARRQGRDGDGPEGGRLHRAPLRRLHARLPALLHLGRQGLPAEGARAAARLAPVEGPRRRQPAARSARTSRSAPSSRRANFEESEFLVFATKKGMVKKTKLAEYNTPLKADGIIAINLKEGDELVGVRHSTGERRHPDGLARAARRSASTRRRPARWAARPPASRACACARTTR